MEKSLEIFGCDDIELWAPEPSLVIDAPLWDYQKSDGSGAELASQTESAPESAPVFFFEMLGDPLFAYEPADRTNPLATKAEVDGLNSLLIGPIPAASSVQTPSARPQTQRSAPAKPSGSAFQKFMRDMIAYANRTADIAKGDARRQAEISRIVDVWANHQGIPAKRLESELDRVKRRMARFVHEVLVEI